MSTMLLYIVKAHTINAEFKFRWMVGYLHYCEHDIVFSMFSELDDVVNATLYLLSDKAKMINGIIMPVDGGTTTQL